MAIQQTQALRNAAVRERNILRNVYTWMALGLAITGVVAMYVSGNAQLVRSIVMNRGLFIALIIGELALVWILSANIHRMSPTAATLSFAGYALLNGVTLSVIFLAYTGVSMFLGSATLDYAISFIGVFLFMGLTAYDTQMIKRWSDEIGNSADEADYMRVSIMGALKLYLDFINLFLFLLRFLGNRR